ncbi:uncharacterized protein B0H18DRAFT_1024302 [Fomitopsis serialis]|uniref:uncharacterized protein n=1 Tax=Fomitopsis serialis TaxID=139415 RepID=UPI0020080214|nr:uncharacterized protein B0H18DRAFT_1024302 [Neoantrodia serialis]KAH9920359.1 hypothetical protein B0H18DRAFT_1024302 [Neoantrodia serialis]
MADESEWIDIHFRQPAYASNVVPTFAQELIDIIADYLWDEPVQLARCCLVCRAWYFSARQHLHRRTLQSAKDLADLVRILMSKQNRGYGHALHDLEIKDDPARPFAHTFPIRVPASLLSRLDGLGFSQLDWTKARPHVRFFKHLAYFSTVTRLSLVGCSFRRADELRTLINTLPSLSMLLLDSIAFQPESPDTARLPRPFQPDFARSSTLVRSGLRLPRGDVQRTTPPSNSSRSSVHSRRFAPCT